MNEARALIESKDTYRIELELAEGGQSYSFKAQHLVLRTPVFLKVTDRVPDDSISFREPELLLQCKGEGIVEIYNAETLSEKYVLTVTKWMNGGSLLSLLQEAARIPLRQSIRFVVDILTGLSTIHGKGFVHRELKPANLLHSEGRAYISDFGSMARTNEQGFVKSDSKHAIAYRPPELFKTGHYFKASDIYQVGIVLHEMINGSIPYSYESYVQKKDLIQLERSGKKLDELDLIEKDLFLKKCVESRIIEGAIPFAPPQPWFTRNLRKIVADMMKVDITKRLQTCSAVSARLAQISVPNWIHHPEEEFVYMCEDWRGYDIRVVARKKAAEERFDVIRARHGGGQFRFKHKNLKSNELPRIFETILDW